MKRKDPLKILTSQTKANVSFLMMSSPNGTISSNVDLNRRKLRKLLFTHYYVTKIIGLPLVSGIMLLWLASIYIQMLTLGSRRSDRSVLSLAIFMMKFEFSCQSLELISHLAQPVC